MKTLLVLFLSASFLFSKVLNIGIVPYKTPQELIKIYKPLITHIEKNSDYKVHLHFPKDYKDILTLIKQNRIDLASITSYLYVKKQNELKNRVRYMATGLRNNKGIITWYYNSFIIAKKNSDIKSLNDLKNRSFAFTDINSTSGFLYPKNILLKAGIDYKKDLSKYFFLKKHNRVIKALMTNSIDAAATYDQIVYDAMKQYPNQIKILARSVPIPIDSFVSTKRISLEEHNRLKKILLDYVFINSSKYIAGFVDIDKKVFKDIEELISFSKD